MMFGDIVEPSVKVGTQQWYTVPVSILVHTAAVLALIVIPLMAADVLPTPPTMMAFAGVPPPAHRAHGCGLRLRRPRPHPPPRLHRRRRRLRRRSRSWK